MRHSPRPLRATVFAAYAAVIGSFGGATLAPGQVATPGGLPEPFYEHTLDLSRAFGLEMIERRLALVERHQPLAFELYVEIAEMPTADFGRFSGTLAAKDAQLHNDLFIALWDVVKAIHSTDDVPAAVAKARALVGKARELLIDPSLLRNEAFLAAMAVDLLVAGEGVGEAFQEMFLSPWQYANGVVALELVKERWATLERRASETAKDEGRAAIAVLDDLYRTPTPPDARERRLTPEDAEAPAQRLAGIFEDVVRADLFPGRDFVRLARHLHALTRQACIAYDNGEEGAGDETIYAVGHHYGTQLAALLELTEPQLHAGIVELMGLLVKTDDLIEGAEAAELERERKKREAAIAALRPGEMLDDDDDEEQTAPGWVVCPDLEFLLEIAIGKLGG